MARPRGCGRTAARRSGGRSRSGRRARADRAPCGGGARGALQLGSAPGSAGLEIVRAPHDGDGAIVEVVEACVDDDVLVVTSDRELQVRVQERGASFRGAGWLRGVIDSAQP